MKTFIKITLLLVTVSFAGCWNMYNDAADDKDEEYQFYLAVASTSYVFTYSMDSSSSLSFIGQFAAGGYSGVDGKYLVAHPNGNFLYVGNDASNNILMYSVLPNVNLVPLTPSSVSFTGDQGQIIIHPSGSSLFIPNNSGSSNVIYKYNINNDGILSSSPTSFTTAIAKAKRIAIDPSGEFLYVLTPQVDGAGSNQYIEKFSTNNLSLIDSITFFMAANLTSWDLKIHPNNQYIYVAAEDGIRTYTTDLQYVDLYSAGMSNRAVLTIHNRGKYLYCTGGNTLYYFSIESNGTVANQKSILGSSSSYIDGIVSPYSNRLFINIYGPSAARVDTFTLDAYGLPVSESPFFIGINTDLWGITLIRKKIN